MSPSTIKFYLNHPSLDWRCSFCVLPNLSDSFFADEMDLADQTNEFWSEEDYANQSMTDTVTSNNGSSDLEETYANQSTVDTSNLNHDELTELHHLIQKRKRQPNEALLIHLNINSLQNKFEELKSINDQLKSHIIFISETKIDKSYPNDQFRLPGYHTYRRDRKKGGGGLLAYFHSNIYSKELKLPKKYKTIEALAIEARLDNQDIIFIGIYRPPNIRAIQAEQQRLVMVEDELNDICMWAALKKQAMIITGDLNLDRLRPDRREGKILLDLEEVHDLQCLITKPTRITKTSETLLDVILTTKPEIFKHCGVINPEISDHHLIYGLLTKAVYQHKRKIITFRSLKDVDMDLLNQNLATAPWSVGEIFDSPDDQYDFWFALFESILDEHAPRKKMRVRDKDVPYMTNEWKRAIKNKRKYAKMYARNRSPETWELKRKWRNIATRERRKAIKDYWAQKSSELKTRPRDFFKTFNPFLSSKSKDTTNISIRVNDGIIRDQKNVVEIFGDYFSTMANGIGGQDVLQVGKEDFNRHLSVEAIQHSYHRLHFQFNKIGSRAVENELSNLNIHKATGWDAISNKILKPMAVSLAPSLTTLFNSCIQCGKWPSYWKRGVWTPVFKKEDKTDCTNYRPVTVLNAVAKVFESLLSKQITKKIDSHLYDKLSAYRKRHSCETNLIRVTEDWRKAIDNKECVAVYQQI